MKGIISWVLLVGFTFIGMIACNNNQFKNETPKLQSGVQQAPNALNTATDITIATLEGPTGISMVKMIDGIKTIGGKASVKYDVYANPEKLTAKLVAKQVDFATIPTNQAALLYNKSPDYSLAATTIWGVMYIVSDQESVSKVSDLKGKTISMAGKGTTPDIALRYILTNNKIDPERDVKIEYLQEHTEVAQKLISGLSEYALLPEPFVTSVLSKKPSAKVIIDIQKEWKTINNEAEFPQTCIVVRNEFAKNNPELVTQFLAEYKNSIDWVNTNIEETGKLVDKNKLGLDPQAVVKSIPRCNMKFVSSKDSKNAVTQFLDIIYKYSPEYIGGKLPDEKFYY